MKRSIFCLLMLIVTIITSCSDDNLFPTVEKENVVIYLDYNNQEKIPVPAFSSIVSFDDEIIHAELVDGFVQIRGIKEGNTIIKTDSKKGIKTEISVDVEYALYNRNWTFISSDLNIDCDDPNIKQTIKEDVEQYIILSMNTHGQRSEIIFLADNKLEFKTFINNQYEIKKGTYIYNIPELKLLFEQDNEIRCEFTILEKDGKRWLSTIIQDLSDIYKEKYPDAVHGVKIQYSLEAVDRILDK